MKQLQLKTICQLYWCCRIKGTFTVSSPHLQQTSHPTLEHSLQKMCSYLPGCTAHSRGSGMHFFRVSTITSTNGAGTKLSSATGILSREIGHYIFIQIYFSLEQIFSPIPSAKQQSRNMITVITCNVDSDWRWIDCRPFRDTGCRRFWSRGGRDVRWPDQSGKSRTGACLPCRELARQSGWPIVAVHPFSQSQWNGFEKLETLIENWKWKQKITDQRFLFNDTKKNERTNNVHIQRDGNVERKWKKLACEVWRIVGKLFRLRFFVDTQWNHEMSQMIVAEKVKVSRSNYHYNKWKSAEKKHETHIQGKHEEYNS